MPEQVKPSTPTVTSKGVTSLSEATFSGDKQDLMEDAQLQRDGKLKPDNTPAPISQNEREKDLLPD